MRTRLTLLLLAALAALALGACGDADYTEDDDNAPACGDHQLGDSWLDDDGCNTCTCTEQGAACTLMACIPGPGACGDHQLGDTWSDGCNTCSCTEQGATCTTMGCPPDPCDGQAPGHTFPAPDGCNTCSCDADGSHSCTEMACPEPVCEELGDAFARTIAQNQGCQVDSDCTDVFTRCVWVDIPGAYGCTAPINTSADQDALRALAQQYSDAGCNGGFCDCAPSPPVACIDNTCAFVDSDDCDGTPNGTTWETEDGCSCACDSGQVLCDCRPPGCGGYALGESWNDGCNGCTCTEDGAICTQRACVAECGDYQLGDSWLDGCAECICTEDGPICEDVECPDLCDGREPGESFPSPDGCNSCFCDEAGNVSCTERACADGCGEYGLGESWDDGCNTCTCTEGGPLCTQRACAEVCDGRQPGEPFPADDGCNTCFCDEDGNVSCTELDCADSCDDIETQYTDLVRANQACDAPEDCQILYGQCGVGLGGCYEATNTSLDQGDLDALGAQYSDAQCTSAVCRCTPPPEVDCVDGACVMVF